MANRLLETGWALAVLLFPVSFSQAATDLRTGGAVGVVLTVTKAGPGFGKVTSVPAAIDCGVNCSASFGAGTPITLEAVPDPGYQFVGWLGRCTGASTCSFTIGADAMATATFAPVSLGAPRIDVDDNGRCDALTDGLLVVRYLFGLAGNALVQSAVGSEAARLTEPQVATFLNAIRPALDIDGNGATDPLTDGLLTIRYLFGLRGPSLIAGAVGPDATRGTADAIEGRIQELCQPPAAITAESCNARDDSGDGVVDANLGTFSIGMGACKTTVPACTSGTLGLPVPGTTSAELCNGIDDNCNGAIDETGCGCVYVSLTGSDTNPGTGLLPMRTIQAAINQAASVGPSRVCVATGATCILVANYDENVVMANGVAVHGGYQQSGATWPLNAACITRIRPSVPEGVLFPASITQPTTLFNFTVNAVNASTSSAVTIDGAKNAVLSSLIVSGPATAQQAYGVNVINGAEPTIHRSAIVGGSGSVATIGVRAVNSRLTLTHNCATLDAAGRCSSTPLSATLVPGIRSRSAGASGGGESYGVLLDNSPYSIIERSAVGGVTGDAVAAVRIKGNATGVRLNASYLIASTGAADLHGVWAEDCGNAAPWIVGNALIGATAAQAMSTRVSGVRAIGACNPVIESNVSIKGSLEGLTNSATAGIHCGMNVALVGSQCVIDNNALIQNGVSANAAKTGILCEDGSCGRIERNVIGNAGTSVDAIGIRLERTATFVEGNVIEAGCGTNSSTGIVASGSAARIVNNFVKGGFACGTPPALSRGMLVFNAADAGEVDVHSNTVAAGGTSGAGCTSSALDVDASPTSPPIAGKGRFRNNIFHGGDCNTRYGVRELAVAADPRIFTYNDIAPAGAAAALYLNEAATPLTTAAQINGLVDMTVLQTRAVDPLFVSYPADLKLQLASPLRAAGTATGSPARDFFGQPRNPATPSIGADESP